MCTALSRLVLDLLVLTILSLTCSPVPPAFAKTKQFSKLSPFQKAMALLHVSATPGSLPCREQQRGMLHSLLEDAIAASTGTCLCT